MTPKEKAYDLFMDMKFYIPYVHNPTEPSEDEVAKQCALIAVDELFNETDTVYPSLRKLYWRNVKLEIEKL